jgi:enamine deaminase RidA (YjgF/YER057c/UK114 family)
MDDLQIVNPAGLAPPVGFSHGVLRQGALLALAGQNGHGSTGTILAPGDLVAQTDRALGNLLAVVRAAGGHPGNIVKLVLYVTDITAYREARRALRDVWLRHFGDYYPAMTLIEVAGFFDPDALVEVDGLAVVAASGS